MNKLNLIKMLAEEQGLPKDQAERIVELFFEAIADTLAQGGRVEIRGLLTMFIKAYKGYTGRNSRTGQIVTVEPKRLPFFKVGAELKDRVGR